MPIYLGNTEIGSEYYGSLPQGRIYQGSNIIQNGTLFGDIKFLLLGAGGGGGAGNRPGSEGGSGVIIVKYQFQA